MKKLIKWFASIFEDQAGSASSKRIVLFISMWFLHDIVSGSLNGKAVDQQVLIAVVLLILFCIGAITSEFFKPGNSLLKSDGVQPPNPNDPTPR